MKLATQLSAFPTNKLLTGASVTGIVTAAWAEVAPNYLPALAGPAMSVLVGAAAGAVMGVVAGYFVPDRVNEPK